MLRRLLAHGLPEPPEVAPSPADMLAQALDLPLLAPVRIFWENLNEMRPWWPILLPLLAWVGWRTYWHERARVLNRRDAGSS